VLLNAALRLEILGVNIISRRLTKVSGPPESAIRVLMS
jgi:hypothetical protein